MSIMKLIQYYFLFCLLFLSFAGSAQEISNIHFEQVGKQIHIYYDLKGNETYAMQVFCSTDNGQSWGEPLIYVTGAIGDNQISGNGKGIVWDVLKDTDNLTGEIKFKIVAEPKFTQSKPNDYPGNSGIFVDERDGQEYKWVRIREQVWMAENINIGRRIHHKSRPIRDNNIEKYCYGNNEAMCNDYGGLYTWDEAMLNSMSTGGRGICPEGWHIPSKEEWSDLILAIDDALKSDYKVLNKQRKSKSGVEGINASRYLKSNTKWGNKRLGTDDYKFNALPAGRINYKPTKFEYLTEDAFFWTSSDNTKDYAWARLMTNGSKVHSISGFKKEAMSVRCLKD